MPYDYGADGHFAFFIRWRKVKYRYSPSREAVYCGTFSKQVLRFRIKFAHIISALREFIANRYHLGEKSFF